MQLKGARRILLLLAVLLPAAGCGAGGSSSAATPSTTENPAGAIAPTWLVVAAGSPSASPAPARATSPSATPTSSMSPPADPSCGRRREPGQILVPLTVTVGSGALGVQWPGYGGSAGYRVAAVPQELVNGEQPPVVWQSVGAGDGCTITAAITGLRSGAPYVVWLDAPGSGHQIDGTRLPYSGRSGVVYPT